MVVLDRVEGEVVPTGHGEQGPRFGPFTAGQGNEQLPELGRRVLWEGAQNGFAYYLRNVAQYAGVYGALEAIIVLALWLEISVSIVLYCAEVVAIIIVPARAQRRIAFATPAPVEGKAVDTKEVTG